MNLSFRKGYLSERENSEENLSPVIHLLLNEMIIV